VVTIYRYCSCRQRRLQLVGAATLGRDPPEKMGRENGCELPIAFLGNEASVCRK
jgi:hypothetical protein